MGHPKLGLLGLLLEGGGGLIASAEDQQFRADLQRERDRISGALGGQTTLSLEGRTVQQGQQTFSGTSRTAGPDPFGLGQNFDFSFTGTPFDPNNPGGTVDESRSFVGALGLRDFALEDINALDQAFQARQREGLARLAGRGNQQRLDLRRDFDTELGIEQQALQNRGGGGFLASSLRLQNARARQEGLNRLNAQLTDFDFAAFTRLSGDTLNVQARGDQLRLQAEALPVNTELARTDVQLNFDASSFRPPPGTNPLQNIGGSISQFDAQQDAAHAAQAGSGGPGAGQKAAQGAGGAATGLGIGLALAPVTGGLSIPAAAALTAGGGLTGAAGCLHGDSILESAYASTQISTVEVGEAILCEDGEYHRIVAIDSGDIPESPEREKYVKLVAGSHEVVLTVKHPVGGKPAGEWKNGEEIECFVSKYAVRVEPHDYVPGYDIMVEGDVDYVANGFVISSVIGKIIAEIGMDKWNELRALTVGV